MLRAFALIAALTAAALPSRAAAADDEPAVVAPAAEPAAPARTRVAAQAADEPLAPRPSIWPEIGIGALQLVGGAAAEIGGGALVFAGFNGKAIGGGDYGSLMLVTAIMPAFAASAVCGLGYLSSGYRGRCGWTFLGAYAGATLGVLLGFALAPEPGYDDTAAFTNSMTALVGVVFLTPVGAVIGHHVGKKEIRRERTAPTAFAPPPDDGRMFATAVPEPRRVGFATSAPRLLLPLMTVSW